MNVNAPVTPDAVSGDPITYTLEITATDADGLTSVCSVTVDVMLTNDHDPVWGTAGGTLYSVSKRTSNNIIIK